MATVLAIDDHPDSLLVLTKILKRLGYDVLSAETAEAGMATLTSEAPDLVIVDHMMPGMNGVEFIRLSRASVRAATTPIILYTAVFDKAFIQDAVAKGANEVWIKGAVSLEQMQERLAHYLKGGAPPNP